MSSADGLSHTDDSGAARMVDVGGKPATARRAVAEARVRISAELQRAIEANAVQKGDVLGVARLAGVMAAKRTGELIPLCHPLPLDHADVRARIADGRVLLRAEASTTAKTGVEMEALVAVAIAALTIIDMGKSIDPAMVVESIRLIEKTGGRRGDVRPHESEFER